KYYKKILPQILNFLDEGFKNIVVIFEIDPGQNKTLGALIHRTFTNRLKSLKTKNDLAWLNRFIVIELTNK
ncbi:MAG: hypothetical protein NTX66_03710, partial [Candidatus Falkowbacteria bacterium]|nr:hypothetical protein [Candidatus Falkowbacteria bacterium]